jgi:hypothetical protein
MDITLTHKFLYTCYDLKDLTNSSTLAEFVKKLKKQAESDPARHDPMKYLGDGFELFVEALIKLSPVDNRVGITDYQNAPYDEAGVDGFGLGLNGRPAAVQVKFKSDHESLLTETRDNMAGFLSVAQSSDYNVLRNDFATNLLVITYGEGLHPKTKEHFFRDGVRVLGRSELRQLVDNNLMFWKHFADLVAAYV